MGLEDADWEILAKAKNLIKISRRDLGYAISQNMSGGTTVAGTMSVAHKMGIDIFATGGIGGVHRGVEETGDVSADLIELSRTPVTVFSSGVKSILDIPRTLEYLESVGVMVGVFKGDNGQFPAFYTRSSGQDSVYNFESIGHIVKLLEAHRALEEKAGILIGVPIPKENELKKSEIDAAIERALSAAKEKGISGKAVTPFLLGTVLKATSGESLIASKSIVNFSKVMFRGSMCFIISDKALIKNNACVAAKVAAQLKGSQTTVSSSASESSAKRSVGIPVSKLVL